MRHNIKQLLIERGMTQKELALQVGMSEVGISKLMVKGEAPKSTLEKIASVLEVQLEKITDEQQPSSILHEGTLDIGGSEVRCYVLSDGRRVLSGRGMQEALKMVDTENGKKTAGTRLTRYFDQKTLNPFIFRERSADHFDPIIASIKGRPYTAMRLLCLLIFAMPS